MTDYVKIRFTRGDSGAVVTKPFKLRGDHTGRLLQFTVLESKDLTADVIFKKRSINNGGLQGELLINYDSVDDITTVTPTTVPEDTESIKDGTYYFSLTSKAIDNISDVETPVKGDFIIEWDGESSFNGIELLEDTKRFIHITADQAEVDEMIICKLDPLTGEKVFEMISLAELKSLLNQLP